MKGGSKNRELVVNEGGSQVSVVVAVAVVLVVVVVRIVEEEGE